MLEEMYDNREITKEEYKEAKRRVKKSVADAEKAESRRLSGAAAEPEPEPEPEPKPTVYLNPSSEDLDQWISDWADIVVRR